MSTASRGPTMICQPGSSSSTSPDRPATCPGITSFLWLIRLSMPESLTVLAIFSASNLPAAQAVSTDRPSLSATSSHAGVVIIDHLVPAAVYALLTLRQNIYTDPQKPIQMEPKLYEVGSAVPDSPVLITTN